MIENPALLLQDAVRQKGIGPKGSKKLPPELLQNVLPLLSQPDTNSTTAAAFWTACLLLDHSDEEKALLTPIFKNPQKYLSPELQSLTPREADFSKEQSFQDIGSQDFLKILHKVIKKQDLSSSESLEAMQYFWDDSSPDWMKAAFLQAERIKRESFTENLNFFNDLWNRSKRLSVNLPHLIDLCDSYDGTNRSYHFTPFVAAILGALGFPTIIHGVQSLGPKYGITNAQILANAGLPTTLTLKEAKAYLIHPNIGWCYIDQSLFFPELFALEKIRRDMVKRPFLATFEKLLQPIHNKNGNIIITGYVHTHYREEVVKLLSCHNQSKMVFNLRTIEGSTNCWGKKSTPFVGYSVREDPVFQQLSEEGRLSEQTLSLQTILEKQNHQMIEGHIDPIKFGTQCDDHQIMKGISCDQITKAGLAALQGNKGLAQELLIFQTAAVLWLSDLVSNEKEAADQVRNVIFSGEAWKHWENQKG